MVPLAPFLLTGFLALLIFVMLLGGFVLAVLKTIFGGKKRNPQLDAEEARLMQELNHSFQKLEERVESLETIMLETGSTRRGNPTANPQRQPE
jgi:phage shock protein B